MKTKIINGNGRKGRGVLLHATGWIILFILPQLLITGGSFESLRTPLIIFFNTLVFGLIFYVNYLWLIPRLYNKKKHLIYWPSVLVLVIAMHLCSNFLFPKFFPMPSNWTRQQEREIVERRDRERRHSFPARYFTYNYFITAFLVTGFAIALRSSEETTRKEREIKELEKEKLDSELALLKNQVSPHFFFNTLNNIYSLIEINQKDAQEAVLSLSKMMRYLLYESEQGNTKLSHEIEFMRGYIDLMKLRMSSRVKLNVEFPAEYEDKDMPPLLFISFIENAFKHGVSYQGNSFIDIVLKCDKNQISFFTRNSISMINGEAPQADSGIGLENVRKRLALLYPGKHELRIEINESVYKVDLRIDTTSA